MLSNAIQKQDHILIREFIPDEVPFAPRSHNTLVPQNAQMLTHDRLSAARDVHDLGNRSGGILIPEIIQNTQTQRMRHVPDDGRDALECRHINQRLLGCHSN